MTIEQQETEPEAAAIPEDDYRERYRLRAEGREGYRTLAQEREARGLKPCRPCGHLFPEGNNICPRCGVTRKIPARAILELLFLLMMVIGSIGTLIFMWWIL